MVSGKKYNLDPRYFWSESGLTIEVQNLYKNKRFFSRFLFYKAKINCIDNSVMSTFMLKLKSKSDIIRIQIWNVFRGSDVGSMSTPPGSATISKINTIVLWKNRIPWRGCCLALSISFSKCYYVSIFLPNEGKTHQFQFQKYQYIN